MNSTSTYRATHGDGYESTMGRWSRELAQHFVRFTGLSEGELVLDVGCGTGNLAAAVAGRVRSIEVHGVDIAPAYIEHAKAHNPDPRLSFHVGDACALNFSSGTYDRVLSLLALHFVPRWRDAISEMRRVARSGATVAASVWDVRGGFVANRLFFDTAAALDPTAGERRARNYTRPLTRPGELAQAWHDAGFLDISETSLNMRMIYSSFADYWAPYLGQEGPGAEYVGTLEPDARSRLETAVRAAYLDGEPDGPRSYAALAWAVKGVVP